ncbi:response regulator [Candidatus Poribacteria bacterium]|nr:response regulator [Candidatus Poribacteria bacterium]
MTNILIVDDEEIIRNFLSDILSEDGYIVHSFGKAEDALDRISKGDIEILITDIKMKGMNGLDLLKKTKDVNPGIDVIVITAFDSAQNAMESIKLGAVDYLSKPINLEQMRFIINKILQQRIKNKNAEKNDIY